MHLPRARSTRRSRGQVPGGVLAAALRAVKGGQTMGKRPAKSSDDFRRPLMADLLAFGGRKKIRHIGGRWDVFEALRRRSARKVGSPLEKERNRHLEDMGNLLQAARSDSVCALF